jgi:hypothetical protein
MAGLRDAGDRRRKVVVVAAVLASVILLAGCGGGSGSHTYIVTASIPTGGSGLGALGSLFAGGIYITLVTPVAIPQSDLNAMKKTLTFVDHAGGPEVCSYSQKVHGVTGKYAFLNGKEVTIKINGTNPLISTFCSAIQKSGFNPTSLGG